MAYNDIRKLIEGLPDDKKESLAAALERNAGISQNDIARLANDPDTADKLNKLASRIDKNALAALASDPKKLTALLSSPQVKNALKGLKDQR